MKAILRETDSSAMEGELFCREVDATHDTEKKLVFIHKNGHVDEIINMGSPNFHSLTFIRD